MIELRYNSDSVFQLGPYITYTAIEIMVIKLTN